MEARLSAVPVETFRQEVSEPTQVSAARRAIVALAAAAGLDETDCGRVALIVTEAGTNLVKHAGGGQLLARVAQEGAPRGIEILALDAGGGLSRPESAFEDGYSTAGTAGNGLGAIRRVADAFDHHSSSKGFAMLAEIRQRRAGMTPPPPPRPVGVVCRRLPGETACGDGWRVRELPDGALLGVVTDGLGHGPLAARASEAALDVLDRATDTDLEALLARMHDALRPTRGAAVGAVLVDGGTVGYAGVGNIVCRVLHDGQERQLVSHNGIVGHEMRRCRVFAMDAPGAVTVLLHSDGLNSQCALLREPGLAFHAPALVAGVLYRDHWRGRDDATALVLRRAGADGNRA